MSFLFPSMLWALPLVSLPILIHLLNRQRYQRVEFGAMEFLRQAIQRTRRRVLLEDILLLALRTLAVLALILALAGPTTDPNSILGTRAPRAEIVVLDHSMSMNRRVDGVSALERARERVRALLEDLDPGRGDRAALIVAGPTAERPAYGNPAEVRLALDELGEAPATTAALAQALEAARQSASSLEQESGLAPTIRVYSDLQAQTWQLDGPIGESIQALASEGRPLEVVDTGRSGANTAVLALDLNPTRITSGSAADFRATIRRFGPARSVRASVYVGDSPVLTETLEFGDSEELDLQHLLQPVDPGPRGISVRLEGDELLADDASFAILNVAEALPVLVAGFESSGADTRTIAENISNYMDLGPRGPMVVERENPARLSARRLEGIGLVVLADPGELDPSIIEALEEHVSRGGGLLMLAGPQTRPSQWTPLLDAIAPGFGIEVGEVQDATDAPARVSMLQLDHPALQLFGDERWRPLLTEVPHSRFRPLRSNAEAQVQRVLRFVGAEQELSIGDALLTWSWDAGQVGLLAAVPQPNWNFMDQVPGGTLPLLLDLAQSLAPQVGHRQVVTAGEALRIELPGAPAAVSLIAPDQRRVTPAEAATPLPGGRTQLVALDRVLQPGIWTVEADLLEADGLENRHVDRIAVIPPASESDPTPIDGETLQAALPAGSRLVAASQEEADIQLETKTEARLAGLLFAIMASCLVLETILASILDRRRG